jgi:hypothetical protein
MRYTSFGRLRGAARALALGVSVGATGACDSLLEVELPHLLTDDAIAGAATAETQVNSAIALFECGYTAFGVTSLGNEDAMQSIAGVFGGGHGYVATPATGTCDSSSTSAAWFDQIMGARAMLSTAPSRFAATSQGVGRGVYDRLIDDGWVSQVSGGERLAALASLYVAMSLTHMGEFLCEAAIDGSDLLTPTDVLGMAEDWITNRALGHITNAGGFTMPFGIGPTATNLALAVRARIRWANRDYAGAAADANTVLGAAPSFVAWVTRENGVTRRNKIFHNTRDVGFSGMLGVNTWWNPAIRRPNPVTGQPWPNPIPFTGYLFLGIMPDGRTLDVGNIPVRWAEEIRDVNRNPVPLNNGAVSDTRVPHIFKGIQGPQPQDVPARFAAEGDDVPYMTWEELQLMRADREHQLGNLANAIAIVNAIRSSKSLPQISGAYLTTLSDGTDDANDVRWLLLEERRREFFSEGARYWSTKIQNTDVLWFPRLEGQTPFQSYNLQGGVRQTFVTDEYTQNPHFVAAGGLDARGTGCTTLFGSQAPYIQ